MIFWTVPGDAVSPSPAAPDAQNGEKMPHTFETLPRWSRLGTSLSRRWRLAWMRARFPRAHFGPDCDIRHGLHLSLGRNATLEIGPRCILDRDMTLAVDGRLSLGVRVIFGHHCTLAVADSLIIGDNSLLAEMVSIRDHDHAFDRLDVPIRLQGMVSAPVVIGQNVWLGAKVTVVKGVTIGDDAIVAAGAVVTRDVPAGAIVAGVPARLLRWRHESYAQRHAQNTAPNGLES